MSNAEQEDKEPVLPLLPLHQAAEAVNAYQCIDKTRQQLTRIYLTTEASMTDLAAVVNKRSRSTIGYLIRTSLERMFPYLPPEIQEQYKSGEEAYRLRTQAVTNESRKKISNGVIHISDTSEDYHDTLSQAANRRWQRVKKERVLTEPVLPLLPLHQAAEAVNAYQYIDPRREKLTRIYLTTEASMTDLTPLAGVNAVSSVSRLIRTSLETMFPYLPPEIQEQYKSAEEAYRLRKSTTNTVNRRYVRNGKN